MNLWAEEPGEIERGGKAIWGRAKGFVEDFLLDTGFQLALESKSPKDMENSASAPKSLYLLKWGENVNTQTWFLIFVDFTFNICE